jgi:hypothetical protein
MQSGKKERCAHEKKGVVRVPLLAVHRSEWARSQPLRGGGAALERPDCVPEVYINIGDFPDRTPSDVIHLILNDSALCLTKPKLSVAKPVFHADGRRTLGKSDGEPT